MTSYSLTLGRPVDGTRIAHVFQNVLTPADCHGSAFTTCAPPPLRCFSRPACTRGSSRSGSVTRRPTLVMNTYGHVTERMQTEATAIPDRVRRVNDEERDRLTSLEMYFIASKAVRRAEKQLPADPDNRIKRLVLDAERSNAAFHKAPTQGQIKD